jgi:hypothetical protein
MPWMHVKLGVFVCCIYIISSATKYSQLQVDKINYTTNFMCDCGMKVPLLFHFRLFLVLFKKCCQLDLWCNWIICFQYYWCWVLNFIKNTRKKIQITSWWNLLLELYWINLPFANYTKMQDFNYLCFRYEFEYFDDRLDISLSITSLYFDYSALKPKPRIPSRTIRT